MAAKTSGVHSVPVGEEIRLNAKSHPIIDRGSMLVRIEFAPQEEICEKSVENVIGVDWNLVSCLLTSFGTRQRISIFVNTSLLPLPRTKIQKIYYRLARAGYLLHMSMQYCQVWFWVVSSLSKCTFFAVFCRYHSWRLNDQWKHRDIAGAPRRNLLM